MKKMIIAAAAAAMLCSLSASAQNIGSMRFGVVGGLTTASTNLKGSTAADLALTAKTAAAFHVGVAYQIPLPMGFSVQPELRYNMKGMKYEENAANNAIVNSKAGYLELPVQIQWGMDLMMVRPYVFLEPFIGVGLNFKDSVSNIDSFKDAMLKKMEYGLGLGAGVEVSRFQLSLSYYWNMGSLYDDSGNSNVSGVKDVVGKYFSNIGKNFNGLMVSAVCFF